MGDGQPRITKNKPWAILKISRRQYETVRPWKKSGMSRPMFEELLATLPEGFIDQLRLEADAERLLRTVFGEVDRSVSSPLTQLIQTIRHGSPRERRQPGCRRMLPRAGK